MFEFELAKQKRAIVIISRLTVLTLVLGIIGLILVFSNRLKLLLAVEIVVLFLGGICSVVLICSWILLKNRYLMNTKMQAAWKQLLADQSKIDILTGLPNRTMLFEDSTSLIQEKRDFALLVVNMDNLKHINDTLGREQGDSLISRIGVILRNIDEGKQVYRIGQDEFVVIIPQYKFIDEVLAYAEKIIQTFHKPVTVNSTVLHNTMSIGIAMYPLHGEHPEELLKLANGALERAKQTGRNKYLIFQEGMVNSSYDKILIEQKLRTALAHDEFLLMYQAQVDTNKKKIVGFEALIRWHNNDLGWVSPGRFIALAENTHLIIPIGDWVIRNSCLFLKKLHMEGFTDLYTSINISILQLLQDDFEDKFFSVLSLMAIEPKYVELEITESILIKSFQDIVDKLKRFREKGVKIALDDFGQGYSSLSYLKKLPVDTIKIDKAFIDDIGENKKDNDLAGIIVQIGHTMGMKIVAEGVEKIEQLKCLIAHGCETAQGYYFSKPVKEIEFKALLERDLGDMFP